MIFTFRFFDVLFIKKKNKSHVRAIFSTLIFFSSDLGSVPQKIK